MAEIPPWTVPPNFLEAIRSGASLALEKRGQDIQANEAAARLALEQSAQVASQNDAAARLAMQQQAQGTAQSEAADRLKLAYDQLAQEQKLTEETNKAKQAQAAAALLQRQQQSDITNQFRLGQMQIEQQRLNKPSASVQLVDDIQSTEAQAIDAEKRGDTEAAAKLRERAQLLADQAKGGEDITMSLDDQNRPVININHGAKSKKVGGDTVATESLAQQKLLKYQNVAQILNYLDKNLKPGDVGVQGAVGDFLDRGLAQLPGFESLYSGERVTNRQALQVARESLMREIGDDRRFTAKDREDISNALPSSGAFESYEDAKKRIQNVRQIISDRARTYSEATGGQVPRFAMTKDELAASYNRKKTSLEKEAAAGIISKASAQAQIKREYDETADALKRYF